MGFAAAAFLSPRNSLLFCSSLRTSSSFLPNCFPFIMKRTYEGLLVPDAMEPPSEAKITHEPERSLKDISGHLRQLILLGKPPPALPGRFRFGKPSWLAPLLAKVEFDVRGDLYQWGMIQLLIFARNYSGMLIHWEALSALVEIWHPQTHTFIFPTFEASVLLEEVELFLGLNLPKTRNKPVAHSMEVMDPVNFLSKLTEDRLQAKHIACSSGIRLSQLAKWAMDAKSEGKKDKVVAQAVSVCLAGLFLFPGQDDILGKEHLGAVDTPF